jgi:hypothetical protein
MRRLLAAVVMAAALAGCGSGSTPARHAPTVAAQLHQPGPPVVRAAVRVVPVPPGAGSEARGDGRVLAGGASCGRERWATKTATDEAAAQIHLEPKATTVETLAALPSTNNGNPDQERTSAEMQTYKLTATLEVAKRESDSDLHLVLVGESGQTMIGEIPDAPACTVPPVTQRVSFLESQIEGARAAFVREFGEPSESFASINHKVTVTGIAFWDILHGQRGVAPSGVELHPIIAIEDP